MEPVAGAVREGIGLSGTPGEKLGRGYSHFGTVCGLAGSEVEGGN
jgi:hypothetical protein